MQPKFIKTASKKESPETIRGKNQVQSANLPSFAMFDKKTFAKMAKIVPKPCISNPKKDQKQNLKINIVPSFLKESKNITFTPPLKSHPTIINMLNRIRVLIKAANLFRFRTHFRTLKFINETQLSLIDDRTYFPEKKPREFYLKRFTEKNMLKKLYYQIMSSFFTNGIINFLKNKYDKFSKCLVERIPFINPFHKTKLFWDILILFTIVWFFFLIPLQLSFGFQFNLDFYKFLESSNLDYNLIKFLVFIPEILLVIDSLLKFITGYHKNGILIIDHEKIIHHYIKKGLLMDILSYLPLVTLAFRPDSGIFLQMMQLFLFLKLNRVKIIINNFKDMILLNGKQDYILSIIILIFQLVFFSHIVACIWHSIAYYYPIENTPTWLDFYDIKSFSWSTKYYHSLFWSVSMMVTVGFGEKVSPRNNLELVVGVWILLISSLLLGYTINAIGSILTEMSRNEIEYKECVSIINHYMKKRTIDFELQSKVRKSLEYTMHQKTNVEKVDEILNKLTPALRKEVLFASRRKFIERFDLFINNFSKDTLDQLTFSLKEVNFSAEEYIYEFNKTDDSSLFIVSEGNVEIIKENEFGVKRILSLKPNDIFGTRSFFTGESREHTVQSQNYSTLYEIKRSDFIKIVQKNPNDFEKFCLVQDKIRHLNNYEGTKIECLSCRLNTHLLHNCPLIHYIPNKDFLIRRHLFNKSQDRNPFFERKLKRKYNAKSNNYSVQKAILQLESEYFSSEEELEDEDIIEKPLEGLEMNLSEKLMFQKPFPESEDNFIIKNEKDFEDFEERNILSKKYKSLVQFPRQKTNENEINTKEFKTRQFLKKKTAILIKNEEIKEKMKEQEKAVEVEKSTEKNKSSLYEEIEIKPLELDGLFNYEFETLRSYNHFFPHNNVKNIIEKIILRQLCLDSPFSVRSRKGRLEKKLRSSKIKFEKLENSKKK